MTYQIIYGGERSKFIRWLPGVAEYTTGRLRYTHSHQNVKVSALGKKELLDLIQAANDDINSFSQGKRGVNKSYQSGKINTNARDRVHEMLDEEIEADRRLIALCNSALGVLKEEPVGKDT